MKNCPVSLFFEKPALEQSLVNFCCSRSSANFCSYSRNKCPCTSASVWEIGLASGNSVGITIDSKIYFAAGFPTPRESLPISLHKSATAPWTLSWLTEITVRRINSMVSSSTVEVNGFHSCSFAFQVSSFQRAAGTKYRMTAFGIVEHHVLSSVLPVSIRFVDMGSVTFLLGSRLLKMTNVLAWIFEHAQ